ncbi:hypothetical protein KBTX_04142 [wastewater metagenome]|uniref:Uncharacterized protein n=2 Tax=unclassified sequences TaxID=12908 RepID=A0A5B8RFE9_9ZZZZ|nr:hypothetical protein KBTEX_04142 [uncultured organism]
MTHGHPAAPGAEIRGGARVGRAHQQVARGARHAQRTGLGHRLADGDVTARADDHGGVHAAQPAGVDASAIHGHAVAGTGTGAGYTVDGGDVERPAGIQRPAAVARLAEGDLPGTAVIDGHGGTTAGTDDGQIALPLAGHIQPAAGIQHPRVEVAAGHGDRQAGRVVVLLIGTGGHRAQRHGSIGAGQGRGRAGLGGVHAESTVLVAGGQGGGGHDLAQRQHPAGVLHRGRGSAEGVVDGDITPAAARDVQPAAGVQRPGLEVAAGHRCLQAVAPADHLAEGHGTAGVGEPHAPGIGRRRAGACLGVIEGEDALGVVHREHAAGDDPVHAQRAARCPADVIGEGRRAAAPGVFNGDIAAPGAGHGEPCGGIEGCGIQLSPGDGDVQPGRPGRHRPQIHVATGVPEYRGIRHRLVQREDAVGVIRSQRGGGMRRADIKPPRGGQGHRITGAHGPRGERAEIGGHLPRAGRHGIGIDGLIAVERHRPGGLDAPAGGIGRPGQVRIPAPGIDALEGRRVDREGRVRRADGPAGVHVDPAAGPGHEVGGIAGNGGDVAGDVQREDCVVFHVDGRDAGVAVHPEGHAVITVEPAAGRHGQAVHVGGQPI